MINKLEWKGLEVGTLKNTQRSNNKIKYNTIQYNTQRSNN